MSDRLTDAELRQAREACEATTGKDWKAVVSYNRTDYEPETDVEFDTDLCWIEGPDYLEDGDSSFFRWEDAEFCATARTLLPRLLDEVQELQRDCKRLSLLFAAMPPSRKRQHQAADRLGLPRFEVALIVALALGTGDALLAAWPEDGPDWLPLAERASR